MSYSPEQNAAAIAKGYTGYEYQLNNTKSSSSSGGGSSNWEDTVKKTIEMYKQANAPAIASFQASIPEVQQSYAAQKANVTAQGQTLADRYKNLLSSLETSKTGDVNKQTLITGQEMGKRGLLPSSTYVQQEIQNRVQPINQQYGQLQTNAALDQTTGQQNLQQLMNQLTSGEVTDTRAINNAIAQLQAGGATSGIQTGTNMYQNLVAQEQARQAQEYKAQQDAIANAIAQSQLGMQQQKNTADIAYTNALTKAKIASTGTGYRPANSYLNTVNTNWELVG